MKHFLFRGRDSCTETGYWEVVVVAGAIEEAQRLFKEHVAGRGHPRYGDTDGGCEVVIGADGVVFSSVEHDGDWDITPQAPQIEMRMGPSGVLEPFDPDGFY